MSQPKPDDEPVARMREAHRYRVFPRVDCEGRFTVIAPNGCSLPLRPLWENEAEFVVNTLNAFAEDLP
jgi:hypothetical protein